jgi:hypothetical protein
MHHQIKQSLEEYLRDGESQETGLPTEFGQHLGECAGCAGELESLEAQSRLLRSLRSPQDIEPRPGFYARVMERIEAQPASIWSVFLERKFGFRLAVASAALVALLGTYLVTTEPNSPEIFGPSVVSTDLPHSAQAGTEEGPSQQQRDAVLVDLASYHE